MVSDRARVSHRDDLRDVAEVSIGDPALGAGDHPLVAVALGAGAHRQYVGPDARLGVRERAGDLGAHQRVEEALLSRLAQVHQVWARPLGPRQRGEAQPQPAAAVDELLDVHRLDAGQAEPADVLGHVRGEQPLGGRAALHLPTGLPHRRGHPALLVERRRPGRADALSGQLFLQRGHLLGQEPLVARQQLRHAATRSCLQFHATSLRLAPVCSRFPVRDDAGHVGAGGRDAGTALLG
jgi:hypothetical protein